MRNTCTIELKHHIYDNCFFRKSRDAKTGTMSIQVYRIGETGYADPLLTVTENLGPQAPRHVAIKNYAENEDAYHNGIYLFPRLRNRRGNLEQIRCITFTD